MAKEKADALERLKRQRHGSDTSLSSVLVGLRLSPSHRVSLVGKGISRIDKVPSEHSEIRVRNSNNTCFY